MNIVDKVCLKCSEIYYAIDEEQAQKVINEIREILETYQSQVLKGSNHADNHDK